MVNKIKNNTSKNITYKDAGVDIKVGNKFVKNIIPLVKETNRPGVMGSIGGFGGLFNLSECGYNNPILVSATDGVGTKLIIAEEVNKHDTIGIDLVAMSVNDIVVQGAEPLFFLDYFATGKLKLKEAKEIIKGITDGLKLANCALLGGETAELPDIYYNNTYDLAGFALGAVEKDNILPKNNMKAGDYIIGLKSSGIHSNGFSLVRKILEISGADLRMAPPFNATSKYREIERFNSDEELTLGEVLLNPTRIYVDPMIPLFEQCRENDTPCNYRDIKGIAHITGGGLSNLLRLHPSLGYHIGAPLPSLPEFDWLQEIGGVSDYEMARTFNLGMGLCVVVSKESANSIMTWLEDSGVQGCAIVGNVNDEGHRVTHINPDICFEHY